MSSRLLQNKLAKNPSKQNDSKRNEGYIEYPLSPFRRFPLLSGYWRNTINEFSPLLAGVFANNDITDFLGCFTRYIEVGEFPFITNKVDIISPNLTLVFPFQSHTARRYSIIPVCFLAKISAAYTGMLVQFHIGIISLHKIRRN